MKFPSCLLMKNNDFMHRLNWKTSFLTLFTGVLLAQQDLLATTKNPSIDLLPRSKIGPSLDTLIPPQRNQRLFTLLQTDRKTAAKK